MQQTQHSHQHVDKLLEVQVVQWIQVYKYQIYINLEEHLLIRLIHHILLLNSRVIDVDGHIFSPRVFPFLFFYFFNSLKKITMSFFFISRSNWRSHSATPLSSNNTSNKSRINISNWLS